jgi:hypothetical protein
MLCEELGHILAKDVAQVEFAGKRYAVRVFDISRLRDRHPFIEHAVYGDVLGLVGAYVSRMGHIQVAYAFMLVLRQFQP